MDRIEKLSKDLQKVKENFELWRYSGLNEEILIVYLSHKMDISKKEVKKFLENVDNFFEDLIVEETIKKL